MTDSDCIFCKIVAGEIAAQIIDEDEDTLAFMDISPATRGHALVIPRRHAKDLLTIERRDLEATVRAAQRLARRITDRLEADGVNLLNSCGRSAWQTVFHFHIHVIPRYRGDGMRHPWAPAASGREELAAVAAALRPA